jgi:serine/threonine protein kinase
MLDGRGQVKLIDFGFAKTLAPSSQPGAAEGEAAKTFTMYGTPLYQVRPPSHRHPSGARGDRGLALL